MLGLWVHMRQKKRAELGSGEDVRTFPSFPVLNDSGFYVKRLCVCFFFYAYATSLNEILVGSLDLKAVAVILG